MTWRDRDLTWIPRRQFEIWVIPSSKTSLAKTQIKDFLEPSFPIRLLHPDTSPETVRGMEISNWHYRYCSDEDITVAIESGLHAMLEDRVRVQ